MRCARSLKRPSSDTLVRKTRSGVGRHGGCPIAAGASDAHSHRSAARGRRCLRTAILTRGAHDYRALVAYGELAQGASGNLVGVLVAGGKSGFSATSDDDDDGLPSVDSAEVYGSP